MVEELRFPDGVGLQNRLMTLSTSLVQHMAVVHGPIGKLVKPPPFQGGYYGFESRWDCHNNKGPCGGMADAPHSKCGDHNRGGSTPSTGTNGLVVKRDNFWFASRHRGFDSLQVHILRNLIAIVHYGDWAKG